MKFSETIMDDEKFIIFSTAVMTVTKANDTLLKLGANIEAGKLIHKGLQMILAQIVEAQKELGLEIEAVKHAEDFLDSQGKELGVARSGSSSE